MKASREGAAMSNKSITTTKPWEAFDEDLTDDSVSAATPELAIEIDNALGLQMISIRLQRSLLTDLKRIAAHNNVGYQPLIRDLLNRFARSEIQSILQDSIIQKQARLKELETEINSQDTMEPIDKFLDREVRRRA